MKLSVEGYFFQSGGVGDSFVTDKSDSHMTAMASNHGVEISTEKVLMVAPHREFPAMAQFVRVVILNKKEDDIQKKPRQRNHKKIIHGFQAHQRES